MRRWDPLVYLVAAFVIFGMCIWAAYSVVQDQKEFLGTGILDEIQYADEDGGSTIILFTDGRRYVLNGRHLVPYPQGTVIKVSRGGKIEKME